jgi:2,4-dienoyl-CoA reductase-like NADH-dependent reductase (Old Yellow Enzyme family)
VWGKQRVGVHLSPRGESHSMGDSSPATTFGYVATELGKRGIAFLCVREYVGASRIGPTLKQAFGGPYIANEKFTQATANQVIGAGEADAVAFGKLFIANPDLPERFAFNAPLNPPREDTFYRGSAQGYTDYPSL